MRRSSEAALRCPRRGEHRGQPGGELEPAAVWSAAIWRAVAPLGRQAAAWAGKGPAALTQEAAARGRARLRSPCGRRRDPLQRGVTMAELQQLRVQEAVDSMVKSLERENIRKMQVAGRGPI